MLTIGDLAALLGVGRHQARRILLVSGLPCKLVTRHWHGIDGRAYTRKTWAVPVEVACLLRLKRTQRQMLREAKHWKINVPASLQSNISRLERACHVTKS